MQVENLQNPPLHLINMRVFIRLRGDEQTGYEWKAANYVRRTPNGHVVVELPSGALVEVNEAQDVLMANEENDTKRNDIEKQHDLDTLCHLNEPAFVEYLNKRYMYDQVYCRSSSVLIAVNPFKKIKGLYDMNDFYGKYATSTGSSRSIPLPPHVFSIADAAYSSLQKSGSSSCSNGQVMNQTILVSGESGAGKTESTKFIMNYLAFLSKQKNSNKSTTAANQQQQEDDDIQTRQALNANPILESFGNARTLRNDNSSRFGKFVRMFFNPNVKNETTENMMIGTRTETYLLEKVRVVSQAKGERNFHIFYELLAGATATTKEFQVQLHLENLQAKDFRYTNGGMCYVRKDQVDDAKQFQRVMNAMSIVGFDLTQQKHILQLLSGLLHLGNVDFSQPTEDEDQGQTHACKVTQVNAKLCLEACADLWGISCETLLKAMIKRQRFVSGECFETCLNQNQCEDARDTMARCLYGFLFKWIIYQLNHLHLVNQSNKNLLLKNKQKQTKYPFIAVLDIFGFEEFETNSFEQFCINYANEKLQFHFIQQIMQKEQEEYQKEKIPWEFVSFQDNAKCLELIENRHGGILSLLDEECLVPKGNDTSFARKLYTTSITNKISSSQHFEATRKDQAENMFCILHYAGKVKYVTKGFCEKNRDQLNPELMEILSHSKYSLMQEIHQLMTSKEEEEEEGEDDDDEQEQEQDQEQDQDNEDDTKERLSRRFSNCSRRDSTSSSSSSSSSSFSFSSTTSSTTVRRIGKYKRRRRHSSVIGAVGIGGQFKQQLIKLLDIVENTQTYYIRCIKPNSQNQKDFFDPQKVANQLRYGGVLKAVEIMRRSFPVRMVHDAFIQRYRVIFTLQQAKNHNVEALIDRLNRRIIKSKLRISSSTTETNTTTGEIILQGKTKVFLRQQVFDFLEKKREEIITVQILRIQSQWRCFWTRKRFLQSLYLIIQVQKKWKAIFLCKQLAQKVRKQHAACVLSRSIGIFVWKKKRLAAIVKIQKVWTRRRRLGQRKLQHQAAAATNSIATTNRMTLPDILSINCPPNMSSKQEESSSNPMIHLDSPASTLSVLSMEVEERLVAPIMPSNRDDQSISPLLQKALDELEKQRRRAEAAENALAHLHQTSHVASKQVVIKSDEFILGNSVDCYGRTPLHRAIEDGETEKVYELLLNQQIDVNQAENRNGATPLHVAVMLARTEIVGLFLGPEVFSRVNLNCRDRNGNTPLHLAISLREDLAERILELLLSFGADPDQLNFMNRTPLHLCAMSHGNVHLMERLLSFQCDPNRRDIVKRTPLHYCVDRSLMPQAILLVRKGADMNISDADGRRVIDHAMSSHLMQYICIKSGWIPDEEIDACMVCMENFGFFSRKNHCDRCGRICCSDCCRMTASNSGTSSSWKGRLCFDCKHFGARHSKDFAA